jgi:hypothetical protein
MHSDQKLPQNGQKQQYLKPQSDRPNFSCIHDHLSSVSALSSPKIARCYDVRCELSDLVHSFVSRVVWEAS